MKWTAARLPAFLALTHPPRRRAAQIVGATCGQIHGDFSAAGNNGAAHEVGARAGASHRAAAFFGLPRLQSMIRAWLKANGVEIEDDGTGVLSETADGSSGDVTKKRKFAG